jgi:hypothetical protein
LFKKMLAVFGIFEQAGSRSAGKSSWESSAREGHKEESALLLAAWVTADLTSVGAKEI